MTSASTPTVFIVEDDARMRVAIQRLLKTVGLRSEAFAGPQDFLGHKLPECPSCVVLDVRLPGMSGLEVQRKLNEMGVTIPIIFITSHGDIPMTVQAMKSGAVDFLTKPVRDQTLLDAVTAAIARDVAQRAKASIVKRTVERLETLTLREREVLAEVARGRLNKQIAHELGISESTVKLHRGSVMRKMQVASMGEFIRVWESLPADLREPHRSRL